MWLIAGTVLAAAGLRSGAAPALLSLLAIPFGMAALGFLQAREKT